MLIKKKVLQMKTNAIFFECIPVDNQILSRHCPKMTSNGGARRAGRRRNLISHMWRYGVMFNLAKPAYYFYKPKSGVSRNGDRHPNRDLATGADGSDNIYYYPFARIHFDKINFERDIYRTVIDRNVTRSSLSSYPL